MPVIPALGRQRQEDHELEARFETKFHIVTLPPKKQQK
jgi:hypothetical protein